MAVFMVNVCKFNSCGLTFKSLGHLIQHIEETHIDYDPLVVEKTEQQHPSCIPLSYVLRFLTDAARRENVKPAQPCNRPIQPAQGNPNRMSLTPTGSEAEEGDDFVSEPEDSNDSWSTQEELSTDFNFRTTNQTSLSPCNKEDKPFACPIPGCKKRYKNVNGIKYHSKNGHKNDGKITHKTYKCPCGKSYKTPYGLKNHTALQHHGSVHQIKVVLPSKSSMAMANNNNNNNNNNSKVMEASSLTDAVSNIINPGSVSGNSIISGSSSGVGLSTSSVSNLSKMPKIKVPPQHHDHVYMKQERVVATTTTSSMNVPEPLTSETDCINNLGILTPASSPPLVSSNINNNSSGGSSSANGSKQQQQQSKLLFNTAANFNLNNNNNNNSNNSNNNSSQTQRNTI